VIAAREREAMSHKVRSVIRWQLYQVRTCRSLHYCEICKRDITDGQKYYDGGYGRRAHMECVLVTELKISCAY